MARAVGLVRLSHPFPSLLNALATLAIATLAGAAPLVAGRLGLSMLGMQVAIGALNDLVDAGRDAAVKPRKPIPSGLVTRGEAKALTASGGVAMVLLAAPSGLGTVVVAALGLGLGFLYDLRLSRTPLSWLPLAVALPLVPILAWLGTTGTVPTGLVVLVLIAVPAGMVLALANGLVDVERDRATGKGGIVVALGSRRAWVLNAAAGVAVLALVVAVIPSVPLGGFAADPGPGDWPVRSAIQRVGLIAGLGAIPVGAILLRSASAGIRERGWELQAVGVLAVGVAWIAGLQPVG